MSRKPPNAFIRWDRIYADWLEGYRPQVMAVRENARRESEGAEDGAQPITPYQICSHAYLNRWPSPWKEIYDGSVYSTMGLMKTTAHQMVAEAVRRGKLAKPTQCPQCLRENIPSRQMHGHHEDYGKPLEVKWLCAKCHSQIPKVWTPNKLQWPFPATA